MFKKIISNRNDILIIEGDSNGLYVSGDIQKPFLSTNTSILWQAMAAYQNKGVNGNIILKDTTSYDSLTVLPGAGTMTGTIRVYGYNQ